MNAHLLGARWLGARWLSARAVVCLIAASAVLTSCSTSPDQGMVAASMTESGVRVVIHWVPSSTEGAAGATGGAVQATFTPVDAGFHLYSTDLPAQGVQGVGRPTRIALDESVVTMGTTTVDRSPEALAVAGITQPVPAYPAGPVTIRVAVTWRSAQRPATVLARISYAACSATTCLPPVTAHPLVLSIPTN